MKKANIKLLKFFYFHIFSNKFIKQQELNFPQTIFKKARNQVRVHSVMSEEVSPNLGCYVAEIGYERSALSEAETPTDLKEYADQVFIQQSIEVDIPQNSCRSLGHCLAYVGYHLMRYLATGMSHADFRRKEH